VISYINKISQIERISFRQDVHALRGLSVLFVVFYHAGFDPFKGGWLGVDIFFVISGYLISNIIISELNLKNFSFKKFYQRRFRRIVPAVLSTLSITSLISFFMLSPKALLEYSKATISTLFFYSNYYFQNLDFYNAVPAKQNPLLHMWTLSVEEQFYIIFPIFVYLVFKLNKKYFLYSILIILTTSLFLNSTTQEISKFYELEFRVWEFLLGVVLVFVNTKKKNFLLSYLGLGLIFFSVFYFEDSMLNLNSIEPKLVALTGTFFLLSNQNFPLKNIFLNKFLAFFASISFSLYLLHQPAFSLMRVYSDIAGFKVTNYHYICMILLLVGMSYINWRFVEKYFLNKKNTQILIIFSLISISMILIFSFYSTNTDGIKSRFDSIPESVLFYSTNINLYLTEEDITQFENYTCVNNIENKKDLVFVGDSQLNTLAVDIFRNYKELGCSYNLKIITNPTGRCLLAKQNDTGIINVCTDEYFLTFVESLKQNTTVVMIGRFDTWLDPLKGGKEVQCNNCDHIEVFKDRVEKISEKSGNVYMFEPIPAFQYSIVNAYLYKQVEWGEPITLDYKDWVNYITPTVNFLDSIKSENIVRIKSDELFCNKFEEKKCSASTSNKLFYTDGVHLTLDGTKLLSEKIFNLLLKENNN